MRNDDWLDVLLRPHAAEGLGGLIEPVAVGHQRAEVVLGPGGLDELDPAYFLLPPTSTLRPRLPKTFVGYRLINCDKASLTLFTGARYNYTDIHLGILDNGDARLPRLRELLGIPGEVGCRRVDRLGRSGRRGAG